MTVLGTRALRRSSRIAALDGFDKQTKTASSIESVGKKPSNEKKRQSDEDIVGLPPRKSAPSGLSRSFEQQLWAKGFQAVAGVDEAGRGPLAGPVVAAACIIPDEVNIVGIDDSKKLAAAERESLYAELTSHPDIIWAVKTVDVQTIDGINILQATMLAMEQAVLSLSKRPDFVLVDGNRVPSGLNPKNIKPIIKGDSKCYSIAAASVIAKVTRDRIMDTLHVQYPMYNFASHRGYGVPEHVRLIRKYGPCPAHRRSFKPVKEWFPVELEHTDDKLDNN